MALVLLAGTLQPLGLNAGKCEDTYNQRVREINRHCEAEIADVQANRRRYDYGWDGRGTRPSESLIENFRKRRDEAIAGEKQARDACLAEERRAAAAAAREINRETERFEEQVRAIDTGATGRDPAALRGNAQDLKRQAKTLEDQASKHLLAGEYDRARALNNQASVLKRGASRLESAASAETYKQEADARKAKEEADKHAAEQIDRQTDAVRQQGMGFNPYSATGDPAELREQANQAREQARQKRQEAWSALSAGNSQQQWALNWQAQELENVANKLETASRNVEYRRQSEDFQARLQQQADAAARSGLQGAASGVADEYGTLVRDTVEEVVGLPAVPGRYTGERVREYLESATDHVGTVVPLADTTAGYIAGPMRQEINRLLDSSRNLPPSGNTGGGYSGSAPTAGTRSWSTAPPTESTHPDYERTVNDAFDDLQEIARQKQAEQQKLNELLKLLNTPAPTSTPSSPDRRYRFDQPTPSASPPPRRYRFDATPTPSGESLDLRSRRSRFD